MFPTPFIIREMYSKSYYLFYVKRICNFANLFKRPLQSFLGTTECSLYWTSRLNRCLYYTSYQLLVTYSILIDLSASWYTRNIYMLLVYLFFKKNTLCFPSPFSYRIDDVPTLLLRRAEHAASSRQVELCNISHVFHRGKRIYPLAFGTHHRNLNK